MGEVLKALGLTPPAIAIILALGGVLVGVGKQIINYLNQERIEFKNDLNEIKKDLKEVKENDKKQNKGLVQVLYHNCLIEALKWKELGYIDNDAKIQFNYRWDKYKEFGDGLGNDPKEIIDKLDIKI